MIKRFQEWLRSEGRPNQEVPNYELPFAQFDDSPFIRAPLQVSEEYEAVLESLRITLKGYHDVAFPAGGFAACCLGTTDSYAFSDIDVFCANPDTYYELREYEADNCMEIQPERRTKFPMRTIMLRGEPLEIDLVNITNNPQYFEIDIPEDGIITVEAVLKIFDLSWAMVGIDLVTNEIVFHELATKPVPYINTKRADVSTADRIMKYRDRFTRITQETEIATREILAHLKQLDE